LAFIQDRLASGDTAPTVREIADRFRIRSPNGVAGHLRALERKGYIDRRAFKARSIRLAAEYSEQTRGLPLVGRVQAGTMREAIGEHAERVDLGSMFDQRGTFALRVEGESMIDVHIADGDYVIVQPDRAAAAGDIAVVQTENGEATVKFWFPEKRRIRLQPANRRMKPIFVKDARVLGVVVGVIRCL
jgi:repressor LexA